MSSGGFVWDSSVVLDERSYAACAVASWQGRLCLAWTGTDLRLNTMWSTDGRQYAGKQTWQHRSYRSESSTNMSTGSSDTTFVPLGPALAAAARGVRLAWTSYNRRLNVMALEHGDAGHVVVKERTLLAPAACGVGQEAALVWIGMDRHINLSYSRAAGFGPGVRLAETTSAPPSVCAWADDLVLSWTGTDRRLNLLVSASGSFGRPVTLRETSSLGPAVCGLFDEVVLAWTGSDRRINLIPLHRHGPSAAPMRLDATTSCAPAICAHLGRLILAWTGSDGRPNVASLRRAA
jgi:hypothetical protein